VVKLFGLSIAKVSSGKGALQAAIISSVIGFWVAMATMAPASKSGVFLTFISYPPSDNLSIMIGCSLSKTEIIANNILPIIKIIWLFSIEMLSSSVHPKSTEKAVQALKQ
jgi:hypothetical protein